MEELSPDPVNIYNVKKKSYGILFFAVVHTSPQNYQEGYWTKSWFYVFFIVLSTRSIL